MGKPEETGGRGENRKRWYGIHKEMSGWKVSRKRTKSFKIEERKRKVKECRGGTAELDVWRRAEIDWSQTGCMHLRESLW